MKTKIAFLCAFLLTLAASPVFAQSCGRGVVVRGNPVCSTPVVVHHKPAVAVVNHHEVITPVAVPVALPVIVPAFTYQYVPPVVAAAPVYPGAPAPGVGQPYPVYPGGQPAGPGTPTYGQPVYGQPVQYHGPYQQPPVQPQPGVPGVDNGNAKLRELAKLLLEEMRRQDAAEGGQDDGPPMAVYPGAQAPVTPPAQPPVGGPPAQPPVGNLGGRPNPQSPFAQPAINALAKNCMNCHTGPGSKGDVVIFSQLNQLNPEAPFKTMLREIQQGRMPPRQSNFAFTQQELQVVQAWLEGR